MKGKKFLKMLKRPKGFFLALIYVLTAVFISAAVTAVVLTTKYNTMGVISYVLFGFSAVFLAYTIYTFVIYAPTMKTVIRNKLYGWSFTSNLMQKYGFKTVVFSLVSLAMNIAFATINCVSAVMYKSLWYGSVAAYYFMLILFRASVIVSSQVCAKKLEGEQDKLEISKLKIYLGSGIFLFVLEIAMAAAVTQLIVFPRPAVTGEITAITTAAYTFYKVVLAIVNIVRAKKFSDPVIQSLRNLGFADACMSIVSLTVLMLSSFGENGELNILKACVGFFACAITVVLALLMIISASLKLKEKKNGKRQG